jgi:hypothetical protein
MQHSAVRVEAKAFFAVALLSGCEFVPPSAAPRDAAIAPDTETLRTDARAEDAIETAKDAAFLDADDASIGVDLPPAIDAAKDAEPLEAGAPDADLDAGFADADAGQAVCLMASTTSNRSFDANQEPLRALVFGTSPLFVLDGQFTIELWLKHRDEQGAGSTVILERMERDGTNLPQNGWSVRVDPGQPATLRFEAARSGAIVLMSDAVSLGAVNRWNHIAITGTRSSSAAHVVIVVNGAIASDVRTTDGYAVPLSVVMQLPAYGGATPRLRTRIDDLHIRRRAITAPFDPSARVPAAIQADTVGLWPMNELNGNRSAADETCQNPATVPAGDFTDDSAVP